MITLTGIFDYIEWDIDKEKERNRKNAEKILRRFPDVEGLKEVLDDVQSLMDSEIYGRVFEASNSDDAAKVLQENGDFSMLSGEYLVEHYRQARYATSVLKDPPLYDIPWLFTDVIISTHYIAITGIIGLINHAYKQSKISLEDVDKERSIFEHVMVLLDDFDKPIKIQPPDEEFYQKLRKIKWNKQGKKLFLKIRDIYYDIKMVRWEGTGDFDTTEYFAVMFLAACNAVNQGRKKILAEDVVVAYRTYLKLLNTDITKLDVLTLGNL